MKIKAKKLFSFFLSLTILFSVCIFTGCEKEEENYSWEISLVESYLPTEGRLSDLPWFMTLVEATEFFDLYSLPEGEFSLGSLTGKREDDMLTIDNVKLKEFPEPVAMVLYFIDSNNLPNPNITDKKGYLLYEYGFEIKNLDKEYLKSFKKGMKNWLKKADKSYRKELKKANLDSEMFQKMLEDPTKSAIIPYTFPGQQEPTNIKVTCNDAVIHFQIMELSNDSM